MDKNTQNPFDLFASSSDAGMQDAVGSTQKKEKGPKKPGFFAGLFGKKKNSTPESQKPGKEGENVQDTSSKIQEKKALKKEKPKKEKAPKKEKPKKVKAPKKEKGPKKSGFFARLFTKKLEAPIQPAHMEMEPYHPELTIGKQETPVVTSQPKAAPAETPVVHEGKQPVVKTATHPQETPAKATPVAEVKEVKKETLVTHEAAKPTPLMGEQTAPMQSKKDTSDEPEIFGNKEPGADIVGNIMKQSSTSGGRTRLSRDTLSFKRTKKTDTKWVTNMLSYALFFVFVLALGGWVFFDIELNLENNMKEQFFNQKSVGKIYKEKEDRIAELGKQVKDYRATLTRLEQRIEELQPGNLTYNTLPFLTEMKKINDERVDWERALDGIENTVAKAGGAQEFLRQLTYQGFTFDTEERQVTLGSPVVQGAFFEEQTADVIGSSISLATQVLEIFERSPYFKDLNQLTFSKSEITDEDSDFGLYQNYQTPIVLNMTYQPAGEQDCRDEGNNCFGLSIDIDAGSTTPSGTIQRQ